MTVQLDAPTTWRITCDTAECHNRLYLTAANQQSAAQRAELEYGWKRTGQHIVCRTHRSTPVAANA